MVDGFCRLGSVLGDPQVRRAPRLRVAWDEITALLQAAYRQARPYLGLSPLLF